MANMDASRQNPAHLDSVDACFSMGRTRFLVTGSLVTSTTLVSPLV